MKQEHNHISYIGGILFFTGLILIFISWYFTYPIHMPEIDEITFTQFYPLIWPGMIFSLLGLFLTGYYSRRKIVKIICTSIFPMVLYIYVFYFSYIPTSDSGNVKAIFEIFHYTGINTVYESYFHFPIYFTLNEMTSQILGFNANNLAIIFFILYGFLIALYIYLFISKTIKNDVYQIAFFAAPLYFIATYSNINYQWVPQTLALVFFLMLLLLFFNQKKSVYKILGIIIFTVLVYTHLFIPAIFLLYIGIYSIKKKELRNSFLLMGCIYIAVLFFHLTYFLKDILIVFKETLYGFGNEYIIHISNSFKEPTGFLSQIISTINRFRIPLIWVVLSTGFFVWFIKRKINFSNVALVLTGGIYIGIGLFYTILGTRALQILFIPLVIGIGFFLSKWKKTTLIFITIIIILSIFGPMRESYDSYQYQLNEEENTCNFLANTISTNQSSKVAIGGLISHYFIKKFDYINMNQDNHIDLWTIIPRNTEFNIFFDTHLKENAYIVYNPKLGKEVISNWMNEKNTSILEDKILFNNKIFECGKTSVIKGR